MLKERTILINQLTPLQVFQRVNFQDIGSHHTYKEVRFKEQNFLLFLENDLKLFSLEYFEFVSKENFIFSLEENNLNDFSTLTPTTLSAVLSLHFKLVKIEEIHPLSRGNFKGKVLLSGNSYVLPLTSNQVISNFLFFNQTENFISKNVDGIWTSALTARVQKSTLHTCFISLFSNREKHDDFHVLVHPMASELCLQKLISFGEKYSLLPFNLNPVNLVETLSLIQTLCRINQLPQGFTFSDCAMHVEIALHKDFPIQALKLVAELSKLMDSLKLIFGADLSEASKKEEATRLLSENGILILSKKGSNNRILVQKNYQANLAVCSFLIEKYSLQNILTI